jgi:hypothetical protein
VNKDYFGLSLLGVFVLLSILFNTPPLPLIIHIPFQTFKHWIKCFILMFSFSLQEKPKAGIISTHFSERKI